VRRARPAFPARAPAAAPPFLRAARRRRGGRALRIGEFPVELLEVRGLRTLFESEGRVAHAVDGVSFTVRAGKTLCLVGESGCGKTVTALSILRLVDPPGRIAGGEVFLEGRDLRTLRERDLRSIRGRDVGMVFQEPAAALNPVFTVGDQISETLRAHRRVTRREARERAIEALKRVRIPAPDRRVDAYPHQMSGGMRQRAMIAMALVCRPKLLLADEPTTALDVTVQAQILALLEELRVEMGMGMLLITHDLGVVAETADEVAVMYAGRIVEQADAAEFFSNPLHPYTRALFRSRPRPGSRDRLEAIPGGVPSPLAFPSGCRFHPRCPLAERRCREEDPVPREIGPGHRVACHLA
jgi:peptide/nickel transport system ATP-binding protein